MFTSSPNWAFNDQEVQEILSLNTSPPFYDKSNVLSKVKAGPDTIGVASGSIFERYYLTNVSNGTVELHSEQDGVWETTGYSIDFQENISNVDFTFDQLGRPIVLVLLSSGSIKLYWYNPVNSSSEIMDISTGTSIAAGFDIVDNPSDELSDAFIAYVRDESLYWRLQRDRWATEYDTGVSGLNLKVKSLALTTQNRLQITYQKDYQDVVITPPIVYLTLAKTISTTYSNFLVNITEKDLPDTDDVWTNLQEELHFRVGEEDVPVKVTFLDIPGRRVSMYAILPEIYGGLSLEIKKGDIGAPDFSDYSFIVCGMSGTEISGNSSLLPTPLTSDNYTVSSGLSVKSGYSVYLSAVESLGSGVLGLVHTPSYVDSSNKAVASIVKTDNSTRMTFVSTLEYGLWSTSDSWLRNGSMNPSAERSSSVLYFDGSNRYHYTANSGATVPEQSSTSFDITNPKTVVLGASVYGGTEYNSGKYHSVFYRKGLITQEELLLISEQGLSGFWVY